MQRLPALTHDRFGLFRFRSPLLTESRLLSLPVGTEMFHFPTFPLPALYIQAGVSRSYCYADRGFPIRRPWDRSPLIGSPRIIADCYVLLRLQLPRHPPFALQNLTHIHEIENRLHHTPPVPGQTRDGFDQWLSSAPHDTERTTNIVFPRIHPHLAKGDGLNEKDARVHYGVLNIRSVLPHPADTRSTSRQESKGRTSPTVPGRRRRSLRTQQRARPRTDQHRTFQTCEQVVLVAAPAFRRPIVDVPPMS